MMETVILKNNSEELEALVNTTMYNLEYMAQTDPMALVDLVMKCRDNEYQFFGTAQERLQKAGLVTNGHIHDSIRNIVLSGVQGDFPDMILSDPRKKAN